jgi:hypothetical protein
LTFQVTLLDFAAAHAASYNALVEVIRRNLLMADWCDDTHYEVGGGNQGQAVDCCWCGYTLLYRAVW